METQKKWLRSPRTNTIQTDNELSPETTMMRTFLLVLLGYIAITSNGIRAEEKAEVVFAETTGVLFCGVLLETYLAFEHLEAHAQAHGISTITTKSVIRHLSAMRGAELQVERLLKAFPNDRILQDYVGKIGAAATAIHAQGESLLKYLRDKDSTSRTAYKKQKEAARTLLIPVFGLPDDRDMVP